MSEPNLAIYLRVSTQEQAKEGVSLTQQLDLCKSYIELHEIDVPHGVKVYRDEGVSGGSLSRPAMTELMNDISNGTIQNMIVLKLDRLTRSMADLCHLVQLIDKNDVTLHSVRDHIDTSSASGRLLLNIMGSVAEWERDTIRERVKSSMQHIRQQGYHVAGPPPYGWEAVKRPDGGPGSLLAISYPNYGTLLKAKYAHHLGRTLNLISEMYLGKRSASAAASMLKAPRVEDMIFVVSDSGRELYKYPAGER